MSNPISVIEASCAIFVLVFLVVQILEKEQRTSKKIVSALLGVTIGWLTVHSLSGFLNGIASEGVLYTLNLLSFLCVPGVSMVFLLFCLKYFKEKAKVPTWVCLTPLIIEGCNFFVFLIYFLMGKMGTYNVETGMFETVLQVPIISRIFYILFAVYVPFSVFYLRKKYNLKSAYIIVLYLVPALVGMILIRTVHIDVTAICNGFVAALVVVVLREIELKEARAGKSVAENNDRILALADDFESLYDVNLKTCGYESYTKGQTYSDYIEPNLVNNNNFFEDTLRNIKNVSYQEDIEEFNKIMNRDFIIEKLESEDHFDHFYRLIIDGQPKWLKMRIVYKNSKKDHIIVGIFSAEKEMAEKAKTETLRRELVEKMIANDALFVIDVEKDKRTTLHNKTIDKDMYSDDDPFSVSVEKYINTFVIPYDRKKVSEMTKLDYVTKKIEEKGEFSFIYRDMSSGAQRYYEIKFAQFSKTEVLMSITEKDFPILENLMTEKIKNDYFALFVVDTDEGYARVFKNDPPEVDVNPGDILPFKDIMDKIALLFKDEEPEVCEYFEQLGSTEFLKRKFATQNKSSYVFKPVHSEIDKWASTTEFVLSRHESNNDPAFIAVCFNVLDKEASENKLLQRSLEQDMQMIGGLASEYEGLLYLNLDDGDFKIYSMTKKMAPIFKRFIGRKKSIGPELLRNYGSSEYVHPSDRTKFDSFCDEYVRSALMGKKKVSERFRGKFDEDYVWMQMDIIKNEDADKRANVIFVGFLECGQEIKREQALQSCFNVLNKDIPSYDAVIEVLSYMTDYYGGGRAYVCEILKQKECIDVTYEYLPANSKIESTRRLEVPLETISKWIDALNQNKTFVIDCADEKMNSRSSIEYFASKGVVNLLIAPVMNNGDLVGYLAIDNPTKSIDDFNSLKIVASIAYSEILRRKENDEEHQTLEKLTDAFVSVYFGDFSRDYLHNWKIVKTHRDALGSINSYTKTMQTYIRNFVLEEERDRCFEQTKAEKVLEAFKTNSIYSVNLTDISLSRPHNIVMDFIKVSDDGNKFVLCIRNITDLLEEEKVQKQKLQDALDAADAANRSKTTFLFNMSHDIRTPMNAIQGFTDMAIKYIDNKEKALDCLKKTQQSSAMLLSLINSVLEVSRIESGHATLDCQPGDVMYSFANIESTLQELAKVKEISLTFSFGEIRNRYVMCDFSRCIRIFVNVISNAIKYTNNGGKVDVYCEEIGEPIDGVSKFRYVIKDNGIGMSDEFQKHVFEQFSREKTTTVSGIQGTGLGMAVVKSLVDLMKGTIVCDSKKDVGTTFEIILPFELQKNEKKYVDPDTNRVIAIGEQEEEKEKNNKIRLSNRKVLLVDDNALNREIAAEILGDEGMVVEPAFDGLMAVNTIKEKGPDYYDFILMDIQMPIMNGYDATREIRKLFPDSKLPIIALSANAFKEDKIASMEAGMNDHVAKPINVKELIEVLSKCIKK